ncbi:MAG: PEP-CTERM sorting domain-containing protein [Pirellulaceae bacterium]|nr:PEP-CTERM sorting domain-containing protein [Planctomycetaceae bacterium]MDG2381385.1 PEP-CTERM sorting domain-containing protein [Pirellulaceae bacterium]
MTVLTRSILLTCCLAVLLVGTTFAQISVVVPEDLIDLEGDTSGPEEFAGAPFRVQFVYEADQFSLPENAGAITGFLLRPDSLIPGPRELAYDDIEVRLSTTEVNSDDIDLIFEDNVGGDELLVYEGELEVSTQAVGPEDGPLEFDYFYPFTTPFDYDPSKGNLLLDVISFSGQDFEQLEDQDSSVVGIYAGDPLSDIGEFLPAGLVVAFLFDSPGLPGDFDGNGILDAIDIDLLSAEVRLGNNTPSFDLNADQKVNDADRGVWVDDLRQTYFGDANLDGEFNSGDFVFVFQAGEYEDAQVGNSTWATGDWNGDAEFNSGDFVIAFQAGGFEQGPRAAVAAVPEPSSLCLILVGAALLVFRRRIA